MSIWTIINIAAWVLCAVFLYLILSDELNQIGVKIDMYRQEYRFTPAFAFIQAV